MACYLCIKNFLIKNSVTDALKSASERVIQNIASATSDLIGNKIEDYIYIYIYIYTYSSIRKIQQIIGILRSLWQYNNGLSKNNLLENTPNQLSKFSAKN